MTRKLYLENAYLKKHVSNIVKKTRIQSKHGIVLDQTVFYPTSGGQPNDTGTMNNIEVIDVLEDQNKQIIHVLEKPLDGLRVECEINWQRRFDHMQQHTGQHILSQALLQTCGAVTVSFHLGQRSCTIDIDLAGLTHEAEERAELLSNRIIFENRETIIHKVGKNEIHRFPLRGLPTVEHNIRILEIKDFDYSPCGGTHCSNTGEIGILKITRLEKYKTGTRIHFICGFRALKDYGIKSSILRRLSSIMNTAEADLIGSTMKLTRNLKKLRGERDELNMKLLDHEANALFSECRIQGGIHLIKRIFNDRLQEDIKLLAKKIVGKYPDTVVLFGIKTGPNAQILFQRSEEPIADMRQLIKIACPIIKGSGGGRPHQAQGGGSAAKKIGEALQVAEDGLFKMIH